MKRGNPSQKSSGDKKSVIHKTKLKKKKVKYGSVK